MVRFNNKVNKFFEKNNVNIHLDVVDGVGLVCFRNFKTDEWSDVYAPLTIDGNNYGLRMSVTEGTTYGDVSRMLAYQIRKTIEHVQNGAKDV